VNTHWINFENWLYYYKRRTILKKCAQNSSSDNTLKNIRIFIITYYLFLRPARMSYIKSLSPRISSLVVVNRGC